MPPAPSTCDNQSVSKHCRVSSDRQRHPSWELLFSSISVKLSLIKTGTFAAPGNASMVGTILKFGFRQNYFLVWNRSKHILLLLFSNFSFFDNQMIKCLIHYTSLLIKQLILSYSPKFVKMAYSVEIRMVLERQHSFCYCLQHIVLRFICFCVMLEPIYCTGNRS